MFNGILNAIGGALRGLFGGQQAPQAPQAPIAPPPQVAPQPQQAPPPQGPQLSQLTSSINQMAGLYPSFDEQIARNQQAQQQVQQQKAQQDLHNKIALNTLIQSLGYGPQAVQQKPIQSQPEAGNALTHNPIYATAESLPIPLISDALRFADPAYGKKNTGDFIQGIAGEGLGAPTNLGGQIAAQITGQPQKTVFNDDIEPFTKTPLLETAGNILGTAGLLAGTKLPVGEALPDAVTPLRNNIPATTVHAAEDAKTTQGMAANGQRFSQEAGKAPEPIKSFAPDPTTGVKMNTEPLPVDPTRNPFFKRLLGSKLTNIRSSSPTGGPELAETINSQIADSSNLANTYLKSQPSVWRLSNKEFVNFADSLEGKAKPANAKVAQAVQEATASLKQVHGDATSTGLKVGDRPNYFPHTYAKGYIDSLKPGSKNFNQAVNHLLETKQAVDVPSAIQMVQDFKAQGNKLGARTFSNFRARTADLPGYEKTKEAYSRYLAGAADATSRAKNYGVKHENVYKLLAKIGQEGGDLDTANKAMGQILTPDHANAVVDGVLKGFSFARLGKAAVAHAGQSINTASDAGIINTLKGVFVKDRDYLDKVGHNSNAEIQGLKSQEVVAKGTAPLLNTVLKWNRDTAAMAGKYFGDAMAKAGNIDTLRRFGVKGDIGPTLTEEQQIQISQSMVNRNMFRSTPADTPINAETSGGRAVGQYRLAYMYKQTGKLYDIVQQASKGNVGPLVRFVSLGIPVGMGVTAVKNAITGHDESKDNVPTQVLHVAENGGMLGLPGAVLSSVNAVHDAKTGIESGAGLVAPVAGEAVKIADVTAQALGGSPKAAERYAAGLVPVAGTRLGKVIAPPAPQSAINYAQTAAQAQKQFLGNKGDLDQWKALHPGSGGAPIDTVAHYSIYQANPNVFKTDQYVALHNPDSAPKGKHDPLFDLNPQQANAVFNIEKIKSSLPGSTSQFAKVDADYIKQVESSPWYQGFSQERGAYYQQLASQGVVSTAKAAAYTPPTPQQSQLLSQMNGLSGGKLSAFINSNAPLQQYLSQHADEANMQRADLGLPPLPKFPTPPNQKVAQEAALYSQLPQGTGARSAFLKSHPDYFAYFQQEQNYYAQVGSSGSSSSKSSSFTQKVATPKFRVPDVDIHIPRVQAGHAKRINIGYHLPHSKVRPMRFPVSKTRSSGGGSNMGVKTQHSTTAKSL